ncbi:MAG: flagellar basal body rod C-terminal domain-containing protein [Oscillospiraceae bacterium]
MAAENCGRRYAGACERQFGSCRRERRPGGSERQARIGSAGTTKLYTGGLETSNVDLATEISEMITTQRGYQANTRIVTVTDSMLEELVNGKKR